MIYNFDSIFTKYEEQYPVVFLCSQYPIFANIVIDRCYEYCKGDLTMDISAYKFFAADETDTQESYLEFPTFLSYVAGKKAIGKWYSKIEYDTAPKTFSEPLYSYLQHPSKNGLLLIVVRDWRNIKKVLANKFYTGNSNICVYNLTFPRKKMLYALIENIFQTHKIDSTKQAINLFITRMGMNYNAYSEQLDLIIQDNKGKSLTYQQMQSYLSGVYNYAVDDFIASVMTNKGKDKIVKNRKAYKILNSLLNEYTASQIVSRVLNRVNVLIEYREIINDGYLPFSHDYDVKKIQEKLPEDSKAKGVSTSYFLKNVELASKTTIKDWYFIKIILSNRANRSEFESFKALMSVIHRFIYNNDRLMNNIRVKDIIDEELFLLNACIPHEMGLKDMLLEDIQIVNNSTS